MKKTIILMTLFILFPVSCKALNCSYAEQAKLRKIASSVTTSYDYVEENDNVDTKAYKSLLNFIDKNSKRIEELTQQIEEVSRKERNKYQEKLEKETDKFQQELDFAMNQIELKDKRIDQLMNMNHELMTQLLSCPCRKNDKIGAENE